MTEGGCIFYFFCHLTRLLQVWAEFWLHSNQNSTPTAMMGNLQYLVTWHCHIYIISGLVNFFSDLKHNFDQPVCNFGSFGLCWAQESCKLLLFGYADLLTDTLIRVMRKEALDLPALFTRGSFHQNMCLFQPH